MRVFVAAVLMQAALSGAAWAQATTNDAAKVQGGHYVVEPQHTRILFSVVHLGFTTYYGDLSGASGTLDFVPADPARSTLAISVPAASVSTTSTKLDGELKGADWFDAAQYPTIMFKSTALQMTGPVDGTVTGDLTLHGVTHPVTLSVHFNGAGINPLDHRYTIGFDATGNLQRSAFGVAKYVPLVSDTVHLILSGAFEGGR